MNLYALIAVIIVCVTALLIVSIWSTTKPNRRR